ncbi:hypothetical protein ILUMI_05547 [Ignelater luminosus]|uniref:Uncharacterized protein n=1 Tax=Ignelater luminosus TaxID=2038154 RepID=A0A8K0DAA0_IGNLU|nr:hypothetical protein ILUMI_05547 [Ignelater luminosus]
MSTPNTVTPGPRARKTAEKPSLLASLLLPKLMKDSEFKTKGMFKTASLRQNQNMMQKQGCNATQHCLKCFLAKRLWMVSVNMYDIMGLLDICPCGTLHSVRPYISYKIKIK